MQKMSSEIRQNESEKKARCVVMGGSGFVGSHTIKALIEKGYQVFNYDLKNGDDIRDIRRLKEVIQPGDKILHLAAIARFAEADQDPETAWTTNVEGTDCVAKAAFLKDAERVVYSSTGSVYMPIEQEGKIDENFRVRGNSVYGCSKHFGELALKRANIDHVILRYAHLYGEGKIGHGAIGGFIARMERGLKPQLYGGAQSNDFTYIKDIVQANILALETENLNQIYNIGTGIELTTEEVFEALKDFFKYNKDFEKLPQRKVDANKFVYDISKAKRELGFIPKFNFKQGMEDWYNNFEKP